MRWRQRDRRVRLRVLACALVFVACGRSEPVAPIAPPLPVPPAPTASTTSDATATLPSSIDDPRLDDTMARLARATLDRLPGAGDDEAALLDRVALQIVAGRQEEALASLQRLRAVTRPADPTRAPVAQIVDELDARAALARSARHVSYDEALAAAFHEVFDRLDDLAASHAAWSLGARLAPAAADVTESLARLRGRDALTLPLDDATALVQRYARWSTLRRVLPLAKPLVDADAARRYVIDDDVRVPTTGGATVSAIVVRPRRLVGPQPAILFFTIYTDGALDPALAAAAHGYVGVVAFPRGKWKSAGPVVPYEHEVDDTCAAIDWIARQPWCDGRVGMYGGSYSGFAQWAATKRMPAALKTIVPYVAAIPGWGLPMENNVFLLANYGWPFYVADGPLDDDRVYFDSKRWDALPDRWYASGRPFRDVDAVDGTPNPLFHRWIAHPSFDAYWRAMVPWGADFARIGIPVLTVTGYYDDGQISALRYFTEHTARRRGAEHYLLIGPWDHFGAQRRPSPVLRGYAIDPVARVDVTYVTFQWMDHVLKGGPMPALLADKVNYEVMGANEWRHAPSIDAMHGEVLTLYLSDHRLVADEPAKPGYLEQVVDLKDRTTQHNVYYPDPIVHDALDDGHGVVFRSEPLPAPMAIDGLLTGELRVAIDKKDFDLGVELYEQTPDGKYVSLTYYLGRASYARDPTTRHLLRPGVVETIPFERTRMTSRLLAKGSRIVVVLNVNASSFAQVNFGTGKDVSDESVSDGAEPLRVRWYGDGFVRLPVRR